MVAEPSTRRVSIREGNASVRRLGGHGRPIRARPPAVVPIRRPRMGIRAQEGQGRDDDERRHKRQPRESDGDLRRYERDKQDQTRQQDATERHTTPEKRSPPHGKPGHHADRDQRELHSGQQSHPGSVTRPGPANKAKQPNRPQPSRRAERAALGEFPASARSATTHCRPKPSRLGPDRRRVGCDRLLGVTPGLRRVRAADRSRGDRRRRRAGGSPRHQAVLGSRDLRGLAPAAVAT